LGALKQLKKSGGIQMKKIITLVCLCLLSANIVGCKSLDLFEENKDAKSFKKLLEANTGHGQKIAKKYTEVGNYVVFEDLTTGKFTAYNMDKYDRKNMKTMDQYLVGASGNDIVKNLNPKSKWIVSSRKVNDYETISYEDKYYDPGCKCTKTEYKSERIKVGSHREDTSSYRVFYHGGGFVFDNTSPISKDLETFEGLKEQASEKFISEKLKSEFSFTSTRASELAQTLTRYNKLGNLRELTTNEKDYFSEKAFGVNFKTMESALTEKAEGRDVAYKSFLEKAAKTNSVGPETIGSFFETYLQ